MGREKERRGERNAKEQRGVHGRKGGRVGTVEGGTETPK